MATIKTIATIKVIIKKIQRNKKKELTEVNSFSSDSNRIQTCNLRIRSAMLYSVELWSRYCWIASAKLQLFSIPTKYFYNFFALFHITYYYWERKILFFNINLSHTAYFFLLFWLYFLIFSTFSVCIFSGFYSFRVKKYIF